MFENVKCGPFNVLTWYRHRRQVTRVNRIMTVMYFMNVISFSFSFPTCTRDQEQLLNRIFCLHNTNNKRNYTQPMRHPQIKHKVSHTYTHIHAHIRIFCIFLGFEFQKFHIGKISYLKRMKPPHISFLRKKIPQLFIKYDTQNTLHRNTSY